MSKPMKPAKAWAVKTRDGSILNHLYKSKSDCTFVLNPTDKWARVRVLDDAAAGRAIEAMRTAAFDETDRASREMLHAAIRDLGGRP